MRLQASATVYGHVLKHYCKGVQMDILLVARFYYVTVEENCAISPDALYLIAGNTV
jgi:hypothetical protein